MKTVHKPKTGAPNQKKREKPAYSPQCLQDIVRKSLILLVRAKLPAPVADVVSSTFASICGEMAYLAVKTPGQVLKIEQQAVAGNDFKRDHLAKENIGKWMNMDIIA